MATYSPTFPSGYATRASKHSLGELSRVFRGQQGDKLGALLAAATGAAAGGATATKTRKRVKAADQFAGGPSGAAVIETRTLVNRVTAAGDISAIDAAVSRSPQPASYVADKSGNGGGGKAGI